MDFGDFKDLPRRAISDKLSRDKVFNIAKNRKYDRCQTGLASMVYKPFDKNSSGADILVGSIKSKLCKHIFRKFEKWNLY